MPNLHDSRKKRKETKQTADSLHRKAKAFALGMKYWISLLLLEREK